MTYIEGILDYCVLVKSFLLCTKKSNI